MLPAWPRSWPRWRSPPDWPSRNPTPTLPQRTAAGNPRKCLQAKTTDWRWIGRRVASHSGHWSGARASSWSSELHSVYQGCVDPYSFLTNPDPAVFLKADPDPYPDMQNWASMPIFYWISFLNYNNIPIINNVFGVFYSVFPPGFRSSALPYATCILHM